FSPAAAAGTRSETSMKETRHDTARTGSSDAFVHQALAPFMHGIAAASIVGAYLDWGSHVLASPDKQRDMFESLTRQWTSWCWFVHQTCVCKFPWGGMPRPHDKRFAN